MLISASKNGSGFAVQRVSPLLTSLLKKYYFTAVESPVNGYGGAMLGSFKVVVNFIKSSSLALFANSPSRSRFVYC